MAEIEVGEFVRTTKGLITKIISIEIEEYEDGTSEIFIETELNPGYLDYTIEDIVKHSKQLIDLIEVGDYVNGREVKHIAMFEGFPDYPKLIFVDEIHLIPSDTCENDEIKTILTKESYMANCYKVGGEDE